MMPLAVVIRRARGEGLPIPEVGRIILRPHGEARMQEAVVIHPDHAIEIEVAGFSGHRSGDAWHYESQDFSALFRRCPEPQRCREAAGPWKLLRGQEIRVFAVEGDTRTDGS